MLKILIKLNFIFYTFDYSNMEETKICTCSNCPFKDVPQSINQFINSRNKSKLTDYCLTCRKYNNSFKKNNNIKEENNNMEEENEETNNLDHPEVSEEFALANGWKKCSRPRGCKYKGKYQPPTQFESRSPGHGPTNECLSCRTTKNDAANNNREKKIANGEGDVLKQKDHEKNIKAYQKQKEKLNENIKNTPIGFQHCSNKNCKDPIQPYYKFKENPGNCEECRNKYREIDANRRDKNKENGKSKEKEIKRTENVEKKIEELKKDVKDGYKICEHIKCNAREQLEEDFIDCNGNLSNNCFRCRYTGNFYSRMSRLNKKDDINHREKIIQQQRDWRINNPDKCIKYNDNRRIDTRSKIKDYISKCENDLKSHKITFDLLFDEAEEYCLSDCYWCGYCPENKQQINGIDRIDNTKGYYPDNCVPCCADCNIMKGEALVDNFIKRCKHLAHKFNSDIGDNTWIYNSDIFFDEKQDGKNHNKSGPNKLFISYMSRAKIKNRKFELTKEIFNDLLKMNCNYCGYSEFIKHNNMTIDRVDSYSHYTLDNCVPACACCNYMKNKIDLNIFKSKITNIAIKHGANY